MEINDNKIPDLATGAKTGLIGAIGGRFLSVLGNVIIARLLGPAVYGLYAIGWTLVRFFSLIVPLGMDRAVLRFAPRFWKKDPAGLKGLLVSADKIALGSGLLTGVFFFCLSPWLANSVYSQPELTTVFHLFAFAFPLISLLVVAAAATRITKQIQYSVWLYDLGQPILGLILIITFFGLGFGLNGIILAEVISLGCAAFTVIFILFKVFPEIKTVVTHREMDSKELLSYSIPAMLGGAFSVYILWLDRIFVGLFLSTYDIGIYTAISQISTVLMVISSGLSPIAVPLFAHYYHSGDKAKLEEVYRISTKWGIYISTPILAVLLVSPTSSLILIFGPEYATGTIPFLILLGGQIINLVTGSVNPLLIMTDNQKILLRASLISLILEIILLVIFIPLWGLIGAAICTSICLSLLYLYVLFWVKRHLNFWPYDKRYFKGLLAGITCFVFVIGYSLINPFSNMVGVFIEALLSILVFSIVLLIQKLDVEDREFLQVLRKK
jgi:O-antigen/teichoic acid export membrane protein